MISTTAAIIVVGAVLAAKFDATKPPHGGTFGYVCLLIIHTACISAMAWALTGFLK